MKSEQHNWLIDSETGLPQTTVIKFSLPYSGWLRLQKSKAWKEVGRIVWREQERECSKSELKEQQFQKGFARNSQHGAHKPSHSAILNTHKRTQGVHRRLGEILQRAGQYLLQK